MSDCATENCSNKPRAANSTIISPGVNHSRKKKDNHVCPTFLKLLETDSVFCESCRFNVDPIGRKIKEATDLGASKKELLRLEIEHNELLKSCKKHDCLISVQVCKNYDCKENIFYSKLPWKKCENQITKLMRNCGLSCGLIGNLTLEQIAKIYGLTRERCRQIEESGLVKIGLRFRQSRDLLAYIPSGGTDNLQALIDKRKEQSKRHTAMKKARRLNQAT